MLVLLEMKLDVGRRGCKRIVETVALFGHYPFFSFFSIGNKLHRAFQKWLEGFPWNKY